METRLRQNVFLRQTKGGRVAVVEDKWLWWRVGGCGGGRVGGCGVPCIQLLQVSPRNLLSIVLCIHN